MKKKMVLMLLLSMMLSILPGCWNKLELDERGFAFGVALDKGAKGQIEMTTQIFRPTPTQGEKGASSQDSNIYVKTTADSVFEAIRDIPIHLGRKAEWSHMRVILVGEELAKTTDVGRLLDFFIRDHEPRHTISMLITKGPAADILEKQPTIEQTSGQQIKIDMEASRANAAKTIDTTLLDFALQVKGATGDAAVAYVTESKKNKNKMLSSVGVALLKKSKLKTVLPPGKVVGLLMLRNEFKSSTISIPCEEKKDGTEIMEIIRLSTKINPKLKGDEVTVKVIAKADGAVGELKCTEIKTSKDEAKYLQRIEEIIKGEMQGTIRFLQAQKTDVIGIGNAIYTKNPKKWKKMKENWGEQFARVPFDIEVQARFLTSGTSINKPTITESK